MTDELKVRVVTVSENGCPTCRLFNVELCDNCVARTINEWVADANRDEAVTTEKQEQT